MSLERHSNQSRLQRYANQLGWDTKMVESIKEDIAARHNLNPYFDEEEINILATEHMRQCINKR